MNALTLTQNRGERRQITEAEAEDILLEMRAIKLVDYLPTMEAMKAKLAAKEAAQMRYHKISRWLKKMDTEDPAIMFPD
jgi:hypothetical protein